MSDRLFRDIAASAYQGCLAPATTTFCLLAIDYRERITIDPRIRSGKPCIRGTRIAVVDVFDSLGGGMSVADVLDDFPDLTAEDIQACFVFAADRDPPADGGAALAGAP